MLVLTPDVNATVGTNESGSGALGHERTTRPRGAGRWCTTCSQNLLHRAPDGVATQSQSSMARVVDRHLPEQNTPAGMAGPVVHPDLIGRVVILPAVPGAEMDHHALDRGRMVGAVVLKPGPRVAPISPCPPPRIQLAHYSLVYTRPPPATLHVLFVSRLERFLQFRPQRITWRARRLGTALAQQGDGGLPDRDCCGVPFQHGRNIPGGPFVAARYAPLRRGLQPFVITVKIQQSDHGVPPQPPISAARSHAARSCDWRPQSLEAPASGHTRRASAHHEPASRPREDPSSPTIVGSDADSHQARQRRMIPRRLNRTGGLSTRRSARSVSPRAT